jgi:leucyl-tRNA synthetase
MDYGTGAIFGVPAHDQRDLDFANVNTNYPMLFPSSCPGRKSKLMKSPTKPIPAPANSRTPEFLERPRESTAAKESVIKKCEADKTGFGTTQFRLRDWGVSRQRYWGCPIPFDPLRQMRRGSGARIRSPRHAAARCHLRQTRQPARASSDMEKNQMPVMQSRRAPRDRHLRHFL